MSIRVDAEAAISIPITVIGGYLGAGKTTLLNSLLHQAAGRRIGVVVNDFGELGIDAQLVGDVDGVPVLNLANGCVCCTLGDDLRETLSALAALNPPLDHIVIEASGVADPVNTAAWGTVPPFVPGGVIVLAAADSISRQANDRYVGVEVRRQLVGADLIILTKTDSCSASDLDQTREWMREASSAPMVESSFGDLPLEVVLDPSVPVALPEPRVVDPHSGRYERWEREWSAPIARDGLERFVEGLPPGLLRLKGFVVIEATSSAASVTVLVQVVGVTVTVSRVEHIPNRSSLSAIGVAGLLDLVELDRLAVRYLSA